MLNKIDLLDEQARDEVRLRYPDAMLVSGVTGEGLEALGARFEAELAHLLCPVELLVPTPTAAASRSCTSWREISRARTRPRASA